MARLFDDASSDDLTVSQVDVSAFPISMACWVRPDAVPNASHVAFSIRRHNQVRGCDLLLNTTSNIAQARTADGTSLSGSSITSAWSLNTWGHLGGVFPSITSRTVIYDGSAGTENTDSRDPFGSPVLNRTTMGMRFQGSEGENFSGDIAEAALWSTALTIEEFVALAAGYSPLLIRPESLISYWPIIGRHSPEIDLVGGNNLTVNGAAASAHPRMFYPARSMSLAVGAVAGTTFNESASLAAQSGLSAAALATIEAAISQGGQSGLSADALATIEAAVAWGGQAGLAAQGAAVFDEAAAVAASNALAVLAGLALDGQAVLAAQSGLAAGAVRVLDLSASLGAQSGLGADAAGAFETAVLVATEGTLAVAVAADLETAVALGALASHDAAVQALISAGIAFGGQSALAMLGELVGLSVPGRVAVTLGGAGVAAALAGAGATAAPGGAATTAAVDGADADDAQGGANASAEVKP